MCRKSFVAALAVAFSFTGHLSAQWTFDDGGTHTLTGDVNDAVYVSNQSHLTIDAISLNADVHVTNAAVDHVNGDFSLHRMTVTDHSVLNTRRRSDGRYTIVDSEANFYAGLYLEGEALDATGSSIVNLYAGEYDAVTSERIVVRGDAGIFVASEATVRVPIFMSGLSRGSARDAIIASLVMKDSSSFDVYGGILSDASADDNWRDRSLRLFDDAKFTMTGGIIDSWLDDGGGPMIETHQRSQVVLRDVQMKSGILSRYGGSLLHLTDESLIQIDSGQFSIGGFEWPNAEGALALLEGGSSFIVNGGRFSVWASEGGTRADIFNLKGTSRVLVTSGEFSATGFSLDPSAPWTPRIVAATGQSKADIRGGTYNVSLNINGELDNFIRHLDARDEATITLHGSGFNYAAGSISDLEGTITGFLLDGSPIEWNFLRESTAHIVLLPEPSAGLLFLGGSALLAIRRRGNRQASVAT